MTAYSTTRDWTPEKPAAKPSRLKSLFATLMHEIEIRRALREVGSLDEAALHDIGISHGSIEDAVRCGRH